MAQKIMVERLFALPYFQQMFEQMLKPIAGMNIELIAEAERIDPQLLAQVTEEAQKYIYHGVVGVAMDFYTKTLTDVDIEFLQGVYQNPTFLKLQKSMPELVTLVLLWSQENQSTISRSIEAAIRKVA